MTIWRKSELSQQRAQKGKAPLKKTPDASLDRHLVGQSRMAVVPREAEVVELRKATLQPL